MTPDAAEQRAQQVIDEIRAELPAVWLGMRQRHILKEAVKRALLEKENDTCGSSL